MFQRVNFLQCFDVYSHSQYRPFFLNTVSNKQGTRYKIFTLRVPVSIVPFRRSASGRQY